MNSPSGVIFVNNNDKVIFMDSCMRKIFLKQQPSYIGKSIVEVLGISYEQYTDLANQVVEKGSKHIVTMELQHAASASKNYSIQGKPIYDFHKHLVSIDYTLSPLDKMVDSATTEVHMARDSENGPVIDYCKQQLEGLYFSMTRWGGKRFGEALNQFFNETATFQGWCINMSGQEIYDPDEAADSDIYVGLLYKSAAYVSKIQGGLATQKQIIQINRNTAEIVFNYIDANWYKKL